jgi:lipopolysaccharide transport system ATP-binding protein
MDALEPAPLAQRRDRKGNQRLTFTAVKLFGAAHLEQRQAVSGQDLFIRFYYTAKEELRGAVVNIAFNVRSSRGALLTNVNSVDVGKSVMDLQQQGYFQCEWPRFNLRSGIYDCALFCEVNGEIADWLQSAFTIVVEDGDFFGTGRVVGREQGDVLFPYDWSCSAAKERA